MDQAAARTHDGGASGESAGRFVPLSVKVGAITVLLVGVAGMVVSSEMARRERARLVEAKTRTAEQATELFAAYDAAALEFADTTTAAQDAAALARSRDFTLVTTFGADGTRVAAVGRHAGRIRFPGLTDATRVKADHLEVVRRIRSLDDRPLGVVEAHVSLAPENAAFEAARVRIVRTVVFGAVLLALALALALRWLVTQPLASLVEAAGRLERGERTVALVHSDDEVGALGRAFQRMAHTIAEREASIRDAKERLQNVLDNMGQAILVFDRSGRIDAERSRQAANLVGAGERSAVDVLFPEGGAGMVEREAFLAWVDAAFDSPPSAFEELVELAPAETVVRTEQGDRCFVLEFRPVAHDDRVDRIMAIATDVTDERAFRADAERKDREHEKRVAAMRRLVAGGGQVFVRFLEGARYRVATAIERLGEISGTNRESVAEVFRHVHTLRGEARCFDLDRVEEILGQIEFELSDLRVRTDERYVVAEAVASVRRQLEQVGREVDAAEALFVEQSPVGASILDQVTVRRSDITALEKLASGRGEELLRVARRLASRPFGESVFVVTESVPRWVQRAGKQATLVVTGRDVPIAPELSRLLPGVLAHLVRNAIAHGIELPDDRVAAGKPSLGTIELGAEALPDGTVRVIVRDDGAGFDVSALRERAKGRGVADLGDLDSLLGHGVSTREKADGLAGFGVGLGSVRDELGQVGFRARIESEPGAGSRIFIEPSKTARSSS